MGVKLSKSAWHSKLQTFTFGENQERPDFCSYFWITVFAMLFSPVAAAGKIVRPFLERDRDWGSFQKRQSNLMFGAQLSWFALVAGGLIFAILFVLFALVELFLTPGVLLVLGVVLAMTLPVIFLVLTRNFWLTYLIAAKDKVCPLITWKD